MISTIFFLLAASAGAAGPGSAAPCPVFPPHRGARIPYERENSPSCRTFYLSQDTDADGRRDWALSHGVLVPGDDDIDGDGTPNVLDPAPFDPGKKGERSPKSVPLHLRVARAEGRQWQERLFQEYGILAIDQTDEQSPAVLETLVELLGRAFSPAEIRSLTGFRYLYAFAGHDAETELAAYHPEAKAISIGGVLSYGRKDAGSESLVVTLAHEIGHAFLWDRLSPAELLSLGERFGGWGKEKGEGGKSLYAPVFFRAHPHLASRAPASREAADRKRFSLTSRLSLSNRHEWFAEAFAAAALRKWKRPTARTAEYWLDYGNLSEALARWIDEKRRLP